MKWIRTRIGPGSDLQTIPLPAFHETTDKLHGPRGARLKIKEYDRANL